MVAGALVALVLLALAASSTLTTDGDLGPSHPPRLLLPAAAGLVVGLGLTILGVRLRRVRLAVDRLLAALSGTLRTDRGAPWVDGVQFADPGRGDWVDSLGRRAEAEPPGRSSCRTPPDPCCACPATVRRTSSGCWPPSPAPRGCPCGTHSSPRSRRARVAEVQASRRRVCTASDAERQRIERDLHDGAQQRLVSAALHLSLVRARLPDDAEVLGQAETTLRDAVADLRRLTHGLFPSLLANEGLRAALDELVRDAEVPTTARHRRR